MPTSAPLPPESGSWTPSFASAGDGGQALLWRQARLRALTAVRAADWPAAWQGLYEALGELPEDQPVTAIALRADLAHCDWLSGHQTQALQGFATALEQADRLGEADRLPLMAVIALVLAGLNQDVAGDVRPDDERLLPGTCSDAAHWPESPTPPALAWLQLLRLEERLGHHTLFTRYGELTASAANPLVRWYHQQLAIRKAVRDDEPAALMPHLLACGRAFRAVLLAEDPGSSVAPDSPEPLAGEILATSVVPSLLATLVLQQGGHDLGRLLEGWLADLAAPATEPALQAWLTGALALMRLSADQAWDVMQDPQQALDARVLAGLRSLSGPVSLDRLFYLHSLVVIWAAQPDTGLGTNLLQAWFPEMVRRAWQMMGAAHPSLQQQPELAETLLRVCLKPPPGWAGVRQILQTAQPAVNVTLGLAVLDAFTTLIGPAAESAA